LFKIQPNVLEDLVNLSVQAGEVLGLDLLDKARFFPQFVPGDAQGPAHPLRHFYGGEFEGVLAFSNGTWSGAGISFKFSKRTNSELIYSFIYPIPKVVDIFPHYRSHFTLESEE